MNNPIFDASALRSLLWSVIDAAAECGTGYIFQGMILPGIFGESVVQDRDGMTWTAAYVWTDKLTASAPFHCPRCREWFGTGRECYRRALHSEPHNSVPFCVGCADRLSEHPAPIGWHSVGFGEDTDALGEDFAEAAMAHASPYGWEFAAGGC